MENVPMVLIRAMAFIFLALLGPLSAFAPQAEAARRVETVVIDAGHGGYDNGLMFSNMKEKDIVLELAKGIKAAIEEQEKKAWLTRKIDQYASLDERRQEANGVQPDVFISLHMSQSDVAAIYVTWYIKDDRNLSINEYYSIAAYQRRYMHESKALARDIGNSLNSFFGVDVAYREMSLELLGSVGGAAIMIELPRGEIDYLEGLSDVVTAIIQGIAAYEQ